MTKMHFELIAAVIKPRIRDAAVVSLAVAFASELRRTNAAFQPSKFLKACGVEDYDTCWLER